jgi:hypothetical protein
VVEALPVKTSPDAAVVLALAGTAAPFASSREDEAEHWLRVLRVHGQAGRALQSLGVGEAPLEPSPLRRNGRRREPGGDPVGDVTRLAVGFARARGSELVTTADVLFGVLLCYGGAFDRALQVRGTTRDELVARLMTPRGRLVVEPESAD